MANKSSAETTVFVFNVCAINDQNEVNDELFETGKQILLRYVQKMILLEPFSQVMILLIGEMENGQQGLFLLDDVSIPTWKTYKVIKKIKPNSTELYTKWKNGFRAIYKILQNANLPEKQKINIILISHTYEDKLIQDEHTDCLIENFKSFKNIEMMWLQPKNFENTSASSTNNCKQLERFLSNFENKVIPAEEYLKNFDYFGGGAKKPVAWNSYLEIAPRMQIRIKAYVYVQKNKPLATALPLVIDNNEEGPNNFIPLLKESTAFDSGRQEYDKHQDTVSGYFFGRKYYPLEANESKIDTKKSLKILYFVNNNDNKIKWNIIGDKTYMIVSEEEEEAKFCSLVQAMIDNKQVGIVRRVYSDGSTPNLNVIYPQAANENYPWCFLMTQLAFRNEMCYFPKSAIPKPDEKQLETAKNFIKAFYQKKSTIRPGTVPSPALEYTWDCITHRALHSINDPLPKPSEKCTELLKRPENIERNKMAEEMINVFKIIKHKDETEDNPIQLSAEEKPSVSDEKDVKPFINTTSSENVPSDYFVLDDD